MLAEDEETCVGSNSLKFFDQGTLEKTMGHKPLGRQLDRNGGRQEDSTHQLIQNLPTGKKEKTSLHAMIPFLLVQFAIVCLGEGFLTRPSPNPLKCSFVVTAIFVPGLLESLRKQGWLL